MQIKRYRAKDMKAALQMIKDELGHEAVILSTREIKGPGRPGTRVEVTAGAGYQPEKPAPRLYGPGHGSRSGPAAPASEPSQAAAGDLDRTLKGLEGGLTEIKEMLRDMTHRARLSENVRRRRDMVRLYRELVESELDPAIARALVERAADDANGGSDPRSLLANRLTRMLKTHLPSVGRDGNGPRHLAVVGPSGVGKTTTLAKLAALFGMKEQWKVAIISLDTVRLGAADQIKTYARIMGLPVRVAQDREEFRQAVELFEDMDLVLIDTSGRCLSHAEGRGELSEAMAGLSRAGVLLVLSAATKDRDLAAAIERAASLDVEGLVITKLDETRAYGNVINNLIKYKKPVSFLTNGQKVPDDLIKATPGLLAGLITSGGMAEFQVGKDV